MSDESDAALALKTSIEQVFAPFQDLLGRLLGPAATEVGLGLADSVKKWRYERQLRFYTQLKTMIEACGLNPKATPPRLFFPILEAASIEDDDDMQSRWAALLANAATTNSVHPSFVEILRQLAPDDALLLDKLYDACISKNTRIVRPWVKLITHFEREQRRAAGENPEAAFNNLIRLGLIQSSYEIVAGKRVLKIIGGHPQILGAPKLKEEYELSEFAFKFVEACRAPRTTISSQGTPGPGEMAQRFPSV